MTITIILGILSVLFAYMAKYRNTRWGLKMSFFLIFLFLALRYDFGNDYMIYYNSFYGIKDLVTIGKEPGWPFLCSIFRPLGFFPLIAVLALFNCIIYYRFIKKYVPPDYYWLAFFLYVFNPNFMLVQSSAIRQSIAIMLFIVSIDYLIKKNVIFYFLCIGVASLFHFSAILLVPIYFFSLTDWKFGKIMGAIALAIYTSFFVVSASLRPVILRFAETFYEHYGSYVEAGFVRSGLGFIYLAIILCIVMYFEKIQSKEISLIFKLSILGLTLQPITLIIEMLSRFLMYFGPTTLCTYPIVVKSIKSSLNKAWLIIILIIISLFQFFQFFYSLTYKENFGVYQTIFSAL